MAEPASAPPVAPGRPLPARLVLGVGAGKGGVGKSTVAVNLAVTLAQQGLRVGLLDADMYGPSVPIMLGLQGFKPTVNERRKIVPALAHGIRCISMGFLVEADMAVAWRGPMVGRAVTQFVDDVEWGDLDWLIVDLPPGTGDILLSLGQLLPMTGAVVVSTPQDVAFADVLRAVRMFSMLKVDVVGLVENMAYFRCPDNGKDYEIFGPSHSPNHCKTHGLTFLGQIPIDMAVSPNADAGLPIVVAAPDSVQSAAYRSIADQIAATLGAKVAAAAGKAPVGHGFFTTR
ncbi:MAG: ATP-binding protein [Myxococcales bacterium]|nr:ATP-binding protein [Myxococcales bacterium]